MLRIVVREEGQRKGKVVGGPVFTDVHIQKIEVPIKKIYGYGVRTTAHDMVYRSRSYTNDVLAFATGRAVIVLDALGVARRVPAAVERHLLARLHQRAIEAIGILSR